MDNFTKFAEQLIPVIRELSRNYVFGRIDLFKKASEGLSPAIRMVRRNSRRCGRLGCDDLEDFSQVDHGAGTKVIVVRDLRSLQQVIQLPNRNACATSNVPPVLCEALQVHDWRLGKQVICASDKKPR